MQATNYDIECFFTVDDYGIDNDRANMTTNFAKALSTYDYYKDEVGTRYELVRLVINTFEVDTEGELNFIDNEVLLEESEK